MQKEFFKDEEIKNLHDLYKVMDKHDLACGIIKLLWDQKEKKKQIEDLQEVVNRLRDRIASA